MNIFKKLARYLVTIYARHLFRQAKNQADAMYRAKPQMYYVASQIFDPTALTIYDKVRFKTEKSCFGYSQVKLLTLISLKNGCYYHTPDTAGNQAMSEHDIDVRRRYFIRERLAKAKLL